jgi:hypothetical protein
VADAPALADAMAAYPRAAYPAATRLPRGRWMGVLEKEHTWFRWRYRLVILLSIALTTKLPPP